MRSNRAPHAHFVFLVDGIAAAGTPLAHAHAGVVIHVEKVVAEAPVQAHFGALEQADRAEGLHPLVGAGEVLEHGDGGARVVDAGAELGADAECFQHRKGPVDGTSAAEVGVDAEVFRPLGAIDSTENFQVIEEAGAARIEA